MAKIEKILSLGADALSSGVAPSYYSKGKGLFYKAYGITPFLGRYGENASTGILRSTSTPVELGDGTIVDQIQASTAQSSVALGSYYFMGSSGNFYKLTYDNTVTNLRSGNLIPTPGRSMEIYKPQGGTEYLYYWQGTQIGRWDLSGTYPTGWTDNHFTGLQSTQHFSHSFNGDIYYTNKDRIGKIYDNAGTAANNTNVLDFPSDYVVKGLTDDGTYLVGVVTTTNESNTFIGNAKVVFWDTFSPSWNKEFKFPEANIYAVRKFGNTLYASGNLGLYAFDFDSEPELILPLASAQVPISNNEFKVWHNTLTWCGSTADSTYFIGTFGKLSPELPFAYHQPFKLTGNPTFIAPRNDDSLFVGIGSELYQADLFGNTTYAIGATTPETTAFDLGDLYNLKRIDLVLNTPLVSGDSIDLSTRTDINGSLTAWDSATHTSKGAVSRVSLYPATPIQTDLFSLSMSIQNDVPIKRIDIYGERQELI